MMFVSMVESYLATETTMLATGRCLLPNQTVGALSCTMLFRKCFHITQALDFVVWVQF